MSSGFIPLHGGYEHLQSYRKSLIIFQATYYLAERWVRLGSRTRDQMEQSARSGKQNIVEGSLASATSKETELRLTNRTSGRGPVDGRSITAVATLDTLPGGSITMAAPVPHRWSQHLAAQ